MNKFALLANSDRQAVFGETANMMKTTPAIIEKDFWVVWVLDKVFAHPELQKILRFKGGTSLSKVFHLIGRFSEDIDLILDWRKVTGEDPYKQRSKNQQSLFNDSINERAVIFIANELLPIISELLAPLCQCAIDTQNPHSINIRYPSAFKDTYLRSEILLEIGPLASWLPASSFAVRPYVADHFPELFAVPECQVETILAERTFWEKATILHQEAHRPAEKLIPSRYSRHYYDLALLAQSPVKDKALSHIGLLADVVEFKQRFYPSAWARYELATPSGLKLVPGAHRLKELQRDYQAMQAMIFDKKLSFDEVMLNLNNLEQEIHHLHTQ